ncbi:hypothetical protein GH714_027384 [Hevea brasiliensis]|uniref:Uncharacterized protein n=1 Tax=Hevea brasiliensis TaxID=3981 RepID=A0A6A6MLA2_HEVBR|nr:hypothetical protein GH714_027384 [Hevea brasiliensis]
MAEATRVKNGEGTFHDEGIRGTLWTETSRAEEGIRNEYQFGYSRTESSLDWQVYVMQLLVDEVEDEDEEFEEGMNVIPAKELQLFLNAIRELNQLLLQYADIFAEPKELPPKRPPYDHNIPLKEGSQPVNVRPHKYAAMQKDVIEKMV